jgi:hypothetical protein
VKKKTYKKLTLINKIKISSLEKKPKKGGTPAIDKNKIVITKTKKKLYFKSVNECKVFELEFMNCVKVQNNIIKEKL